MVVKENGKPVVDAISSHKNSDFLSSLLCVFFFTLLLRTFVEVAVKRSRCFYAFDANLSKLSWLLMLWWKTFAVGLVMAQQIHVLTKITLINILFSDGSNTILSNIERTRTLFFEHRTNSNVFIYWWSNSNTLFLALNEPTSILIGL